MSFASTSPGWNAGARRRCGGGPRKAWEIVGILAAFFYFWPLAVAYLIWKGMGYPLPPEWKEQAEKVFANLKTNPFADSRAFTPRAPRTGNHAFEEYRRSELARLDEERRRIDEDARAFSEFVEDLKRAKDREEFDAFMAKRRDTNANGTTSV